MKKGSYVIEVIPNVLNQELGLIWGMLEAE